MGFWMLVSGNGWMLTLSGVQPNVVGSRLTCQFGIASLVATIAKCVDDLAASTYQFSPENVFRMLTQIAIDVTPGKRPVILVRCVMMWNEPAIGDNFQHVRP